MGAFEIEKLKHRIAFKERARVGSVREWGETPLASAKTGTLMHAWTLEQEASRTQWCLEAFTQCLADKGICLGMSNQETEQENLPLQG